MLEKPKIVFPLVHLNGTHVDDLIQQQRDVRDACSVLYKALADAAPNGRDYYLLGCDVAQKAYDEHKQRLIMVAQIKQDTDRIINSLNRQKDGCLR